MMIMMTQSSFIGEHYHQIGNRQMSDYDGVNGQTKFFSRGFQFDQVSTEEEGMIEHIY